MPACSVSALAIAEKNMPNRQPTTMPITTCQYQGSRCTGAQNLSRLLTLCALMTVFFLGGDDGEAVDSDNQIQTATGVPVHPDLSFQAVSPLIAPADGAL